MSLDKKWKDNDILRKNLIDDKFSNGAKLFQERAIEDIMKLEDRLYEDSDQTTPKELLWEIIGIIENLKP